MTSPIGLVGLESIVYYTQDLERSRRFYVHQLDFAEVARSGQELEKAGGQRSSLFQAGDIRILVQEPLNDSCRAARFLTKHPAGVGTIVFRVEDAEATFAVLEARGGTPLGEIETFSDAEGTLRTFSITTPFGGSTFRFVERRGYRAHAPGLETRSLTTPSNRFGFVGFDHITTNFETMKPALLWMEHVLGFEAYWNIEFHTSDLTPSHQAGSGLRSQVMWDPSSGVKFANNEPWRPHFKTSQINLFTEAQRGDGIQHIAFTTQHMEHAVAGLRDRGVGFLRTPGAYYDALPARLEDSGVGRIEEDIERLRELEILVDGDHSEYLLQIFLQEGAEYYSDPGAGPFFYEIIQRKGHKGFGGGNFRALFESIERTQTARGPY